MNYFKLYIIIVSAIITANAIIKAIDHYRTKELRELEQEKLKLEIELKKRTLKF